MILLKNNEAEHLSIHNQLIIMADIKHACLCGEMSAMHVDFSIYLICIRLNKNKVYKCHYR
jgi:hypothetical protein